MIHAMADQTQVPQVPSYRVAIPLDRFLWPLDWARTCEFRGPVLGTRVSNYEQNRL